jgi:hypothetical protein
MNAITTSNLRYLPDFDKPTPRTHAQSANAAGYAVAGHQPIVLRIHAREERLALLFHTR